MPEFLKERQSNLIFVIVVIAILVGAFFLFGNRQSGEITDEAANQTEEQKKEEEAKKKEEEKKKVEENKLPGEYTVVRGDHLWKIATDMYKDGYKWVLIAEANELPNPNFIIPGQKLTLPKASIGKNYTVVKGDTLWDISKNYYGSGALWTKIKAGNPGKIGKLKNGNPLIMPGQVLKIP